jgi:hypothetical protein
VGDDASERLRREVRRLATKLANSALDPAKKPGEATFDDLSRLERLLEVMESTKPKSEQTVDRSKLRKAWMAFGVIAVVGLLFIVPVSLFFSIEIEGEIVADAISFDVANPVRGPADVPTRELSVSTFHISSFDGAKAPHWKDAEEEFAMEARDGGALSAKAPNDMPITLDLPRMTAATNVQIGRTRVGNQLHMTLSGEKARFVMRSVLPEGSTISTETNSWTYRPDRALYLLIEGENEIDFAFTPATKTEELFEAVIPISSLDFEQSSIAGDIFPVSSIRQGEIYLRGLGSRTVPLRRGQSLRLQITDGVIRFLGASKDGWRLAFAAKVKLLDVDGRSAIPGVLEYWHASSARSLVWTSVVAGFAFLVGLRQWLGWVR